MLACSTLPAIIWDISGREPLSFLPGAQVGLAFVASLAVSRSARLRPLAWFLLTIGIVRLSWSVIGPLFSNALLVRQYLDSASWAARMFVSRLLLSGGAFLLWALCYARGMGPRDLLLRVGAMDASAQPAAGLWFRRPISWNRLGPELLALFGIVLPITLYFTLHPDLRLLGRLSQWWPWALATATLNAANEEFQFRCVPLAQLRGLLRTREVVWLTAVYFGLGHYFGQPSGIPGVVMATAAGWFWGKSIVETRGVGWAFCIHLVQDVVIFCFLALSTSN